MMDFTAFRTAVSLVLIGVVSTAQRPNVVVILADDLGWNDVSFHGSRQIPTPNLDALAYDGIILKNYYVQPICTPTRSALMTGRYPIHTGMQHSVIVGAEPYGLGLDEKIMSQYFKELNYATHIVGKWHLGYHAEEYTPHHRGFDSHYGYYQGCEDYYDHTYTNAGPAGDPKAWGLDFRRNDTVIFDDFGQYSTELFSNEAEKIVENHDTSKPLFLYLPHQAVHSGNPFTKTPLEAPWKYQEKFQHIQNPNRRMFAAMVSALDDAVGNLTKALHRKGLLDNTVIVFSTDNGGPAAGFDFNYANNWPLRGLKSTLWEGGARGAGFIWSPLLQTSGYIAEQMIHVVDWLPTLLRVAGYDMNKLPAKVFDGLDQWDTLSGNGTEYRTEFLYNIDPKESSSAVRVRNMKLVSGRGSTKQYDGWYRPEQVEGDSVNNEGNGVDQRLKVMEKYKNSHLSEKEWVDMYNYETVDNEKARHAFREPLPPQPADAPEVLFKSELNGILRDIGRNPPKNGKPVVVTCPNRPANYSTNCKVSEAPCLFDIDNDPCEFNNLADQQPKVVEYLTKRLQEYAKGMVPPRNKPQDPNGLPYYHKGVWVPWLKATEEKNMN